MKELLQIAILLLAVSCQKESVEKSSAVENETVYNVKKNVMLDLLNKTRRSGCLCGNTQMPPVPELAWNDTLARTAYLHSVDMQSKNFFSHTGSDGSSLSVRVDRQGFAWSSLGENIASGYASDSAVVAGWLKSEGHCKNIMSASFRLVGAGRQQGLWTQVFARRR